MPSLQIRHLPDDVYFALAQRAEQEGRSLAQQAIVELRKMNEIERRSRRRAVIEKIRQELATHPPAATHPSPEELIRQDRDR